MKHLRHHMHWATMCLGNNVSVSLNGSGPHLLNTTLNERVISTKSSTKRFSTIFETRTLKGRGDQQGPQQSLPGAHLTVVHVRHVRRHTEQPEATSWCFMLTSYCPRLCPFPSLSAGPIRTTTAGMPPGSYRPFMCSCTRAAWCPGLWILSPCLAATLLQLSTTTST